MKNNSGGMSIKWKLVLLSIAITLIPIAAITTLYYIKARSTTKEYVLHEMRELAKAKKLHVISLIDAKRGRTLDFSSDGFIKDSLGEMGQYEKLTSELCNALNKHLLRNKKPLDPHIKAIAVLDNNGRVAASTHEVWIGRNMAEQDAFRKAVEMGYNETYVTEPHYSSIIESNVIHFSAPVTSRTDDTTIGVIINAYDISILREVTRHREGLGETGEVVLGLKKEDAVVFLNPLRFATDAALKLRIPLLAEDAKPMKLALEGGSGMVLALDYRNVEVVASYQYIPILKWGLVVKTDKSEVFAPLRMIGIIAIAAGFIATGIAACVGIIFAVATARPINKLKEATEKFRAGNLKYRVEINRKDEIGVLAHSFNVMADTLALESQKLSRAVEQNPGTVVITDTQGVIEYVNPAFEQTSGYTRKEAVGKTPAILNSGMQPKEYFKNMWDTINRGEVWRGEFINKKKSGEIYYEDATIAPVKDESGKTTHFVALKIDVTSRKLTEIELEKKHLELEENTQHERTYGKAMALFSSTYDQDKILNGTLSLLAKNYPIPVSAIYTYDDWTGTLVCSAFRGVQDTLKKEFELGYGLVGQAALERSTLIIEEGNGDMTMDIDTGFTSIKPSMVVASSILYQEKFMGVLVFASTKKLAGSEIRFIERFCAQLGVAFNNLKQYSDLKELSEQIKLRGEEVARKNKELEQANKMKSDFLANMSHELRTPLNAIIGFSEVLRDGLVGELSEEQKEYTDNIFTSGQHLLSLINDILDLSKIDAGRMTLDLEDVNIPEVLSNSVLMVKEKALASSVNVSMRVDEDVDVIYADARKLKQIVFNLVSNAVKFTPEGGSVNLTAKKVRADDVDFLEVSVTDTGIGMSEQDRKKLFRPFEQLDSSMSRKYEGTGLGLAMVKRLVELHGGMVTVTSEPGKGSCFSIGLPFDITRAAPHESVEMADGFMADSSATEVLIVEDDDKAADLMRLQLESEGFRVTRASSAEKGLEMAAQIRPGLITLDILMPGTDGWTFLTKIKEDEDLARIPIVIVSIVADEKKGFSLGASKVLQKPVEKEQLLTSIKELGFYTINTDEPLTVLVVDDDPKAVEIVSLHLDTKGIKVLRAYGGKEGIDIAMRETPDLVVLDLMMPDVTGFDVVNILKQSPKTSEIPIIILTAKVLTEKDMKTLRGNVLDILQKSSYRGDDFAADVRRALYKRATKRNVQLPEKERVLGGAPKRSFSYEEKPLVLIAEDNQKNLEVLKLYIEEGGYRVIQAANGREALVMMHQSKPDLIILDIIMPVMDGFAFLNEKAYNPEFSDIPVVVVSGVADEKKGGLLGANAFLRKPIRRDELLNVVSSIGLKPHKDRKYKILLIDDDPKAVKIVSSYFDSDRYDILKTYSGREGLEAAISNVPDLIVLDLMMPEMDGFEVADTLWESDVTREIPIIILTAKTLTKDEREKLTKMVDFIAQKGRFNKEAFLKEVEMLLKIRSSIRV